MSDFINSAKEGNLAKVKYYLSQKYINVNETDNDGWTALIWAARQGYLDVVKELITHKADINIANNNGYTALIWASFAGHLDVVKELITHKADINIANNNGYTALMYAAQGGHLDVVKELITHKADVNKGNSKGNTTLVCAVWNKHINVIKELIAHNAEINKADNDGKTALIWAAKQGYLDVVKELIIHKAEINKVDKYGKTALIWAADRGRLDVVKELLNAGSDLLLKANDENFASMVLCRVLSNNNAKQIFNKLIMEEGFPGLTAIGKLELLKAFKFMHENSEKFDKCISIEQVKASLEACKPFKVLLGEVASIDLNTKVNTHKLKDGLHKLLSVVKHKEQYGIDIPAYKAKLQKICKNLEVSTGNKYYEFVQYVEKAQQEVKSILDKLKKGNGQTIGVKDPLSDYLLSLSQDYTKLDGWLPIHNVNEALTIDLLDMLLALPKEILATILKKMLSTNKSMMDAQESNGVIVKTLCATEIWDDLSTIKSEATELSGLINQAE